MKRSLIGALAQRVPPNARSALRRLTRPLNYCIDLPTTNVAVVHSQLVIAGWALTRSGSEVAVGLILDDEPFVKVHADRARPDVAARFQLAPGRAECGFEIAVPAWKLPAPPGGILRGRLRFDDGGAAVFSAEFYFVKTEMLKLERSRYKEVWEQSSGAVQDAMLSIAGCADESEFLRLGETTYLMLTALVGVGTGDVVLEIGAGIGRVGRAVAPHCREWIGADVSENMLAHLNERLRDLSNVRTVLLNGRDLSPIADCSVDLVYCTVVFMHLDEQERYNYIREGFRVLRPGGRMLVDNINLLSDEGWGRSMSEEAAYLPEDRPPNYGRPSTPQELEAYFQRAGFKEIGQHLDGAWIIQYGKKPEVRINPDYTPAPSKKSEPAAKS